MDVEIKNRVKLFIEANIVRVQIALALAIIRTKPDGVGAVQHAANIQARCRLKYSNCVLVPNYTDGSSQSILCDHKMLFLQQKQFVSSLQGVLPKALTKNSIPMECQNSQAGCSSDMFASEETAVADDIEMDDCDEDLLTEQNEMNLQFIQAMIQLKSAVNTYSHVPMSDLQNILSTMPFGNNEETNKGETSGLSRLAVLSDSQSSLRDYFHSGLNFGNQFDRRSSISSSTLKYLFRSSDGNRLLVHSVEAVLQYLGYSISSKNSLLDSVVKNWKGSILEYSMKILLELVDLVGQGGELNACRQVCLKFICSTVDNILLSDVINMHPVWKQQCCVLVEFGNSEHLCIDFLNYLFDKLNSMTKYTNQKNASETNAGTSNFVDYVPGDIEKSFYLFYMAEKLLKKWRKYKVSRTATAKNKLSSEVRNTNVVDLWRQHWHGSSASSTDVSSNKQDDTEESMVSKWKDILQKLVIKFTEDYPLITIYSWDCLNLVQNESVK